MESVLKELLKDRPIYVSGWGAVSAVGLGQDALWQAADEGMGLAEARGGVAACRVDQAILTALPAKIRRMDPIAAMAVLAAREALQHAELSAVTEHGDPRLGVIAATSRGPISIWQQGQGVEESGARMSPSFAVNSTLASLSGVIAQEIHARGLSMTVSATCASSAHAIALGAEQLILGKVDRVIVGGSDFGCHPLVIAQMRAAGTLGVHAEPGLSCRPFDQSRNGLVPGDGAGFLLLESGDSLAARGGKALSQLVGWATGTSGAGRAGVDPHGEGLVAVMREASALAGLAPEQISTINAHATGTRLNDRSEALAYRKFLSGSPTIITATKPVTGHCLGATPALEAVLAMRSLIEKSVPPIAGLTDFDPVAQGLILATVPTAIKGRVAMSNSCGFWGTLSSLIFRAV